MTNNRSTCTEAQMLIRKPVEEVFEAFVDPEITKNFWFTRGSGRLEVGKKITWHWDMYNVSTTVVAKKFQGTSKSFLNGIAQQKQLNSISKNWMTTLLM